MKLIAEINNSKHDIEILHQANQAFASVDGRKYDIEVSEPESNVFLIKQNGRVFEAKVYPPDKIDGKTLIRLRGNEFEFRILDPKRLRGKSTGDDQTSGRVEIKTAMPGKVVRILVSQGDAVQKGDGIIVVEAMKMQNEMKSPKDGIVSEIRVAVSDTVGAGEILIVIE